ncbi:MAG: restriction endonuclease subunit S [Breznakibacter sp.]
MEQYEKYKDSGIEWIGEIPEHWGNVSLKWISKIYSGGTPSKSNTEFWNNGTIPWLNSGSVNQVYISEPSEYITEDAFENSSAKWIPINAILIALAGQGKTKGMVAKLLFEATCNQSLGVIVPIRINSDFLLYWLTKNYQNIRFLGGGDQRDGINLEMIGGIKVPIPTFDEQTNIATFLDRKTAEINRIIANKQKLIALYEEEKQAIINQAVTKGLDPNVKMKDSGVEWLGEIPEHWEVKKIKYIGKFINGYSFDSKDFIPSGIRVIKISNIQNMRIDWSDESFVDEELYEKYSAFRIFRDDLIFALTRPIISTGIKATIVDCDEKMLLNQRNSVLRTDKRNIGIKWLYYIILNPNFIQEFDSRIDKTGQQPNISSNDIGDIIIPVPSTEQQIEIIELIEKEFSRLDYVIEKFNKQIDLLKEYRTTLISEVVTGKIKVPNTIEA